MVYDYDKNSNFQRPQIGAFRFLREAKDSVVYLHCDVEACRRDNSESRCAKGCQNGRKRRSLALDIASKQSVSLGPIVSKEPAVAREQESAGSVTIFAAVAGVLGVVVLALIVVLVVLFKRYRRPQNAARVVYTKASSDDGKLLV